MFINYRKIWEDNFGLIPTDENGISYEIHHIDGNRSNNKLDNLKCVSITEHFFIHFEQGDIGACKLILQRIESLQTPEIKKILSTQSTKINKERVSKGTHNFLTQKHSENNKRIQKKLISDGKHHFCQGQSLRGQKSFQSKIDKWKNLNDEQFISYLSNYRLYRTFRVRNGKSVTTISSIVNQALNARFASNNIKKQEILKELIRRHDETHIIQ